MFRFSFVPIQNCVLGSLERLFTRCDHVWNIFKTKGMGKGLSKLAHLNRDLNQVWESSKPLPLSLYPGGPRNDCGRQRWSARPQGCHHHHCIAFITITITIIVINNMNNTDQHAPPQGGEGCSQTLAADKQSVCQRHPLGSG